MRRVDIIVNVDKMSDDSLKHNQADEGDSTKHVDRRSVDSDHDASKCCDVVDELRLNETKHSEKSLEKILQDQSAVL